MTAIMLKKLCDYPELLEKASLWFSGKWDIPVEAYIESIQECINKKIEIPQWYIVVDENQEIIAGAGIIENDFHDRKDLTPNLCALYVEKQYRSKGIAKYILNFARKELGEMGFERLYLVTDHVEFYEKCGWGFLTNVIDKNGNSERMYVASTL